MTKLGQWTMTKGGEMSETKEYSTPELVKRIAEEAPLFFSNIGKDWVFSQGEYEEFIDSLLQSRQQAQTDEELVKIVKKAFDRYNSDVPEPILAEIRKLLGEK